MTLPANSCLCWDRISCEQCGCFDRPMGYTDNRSGAFHHVCQQCGHQWVAISAEDERAAAEGREPASLRRSLLLGFGTVRPTESAEAYRDAIGRAQELGFDELVVYGPFVQPGDHFYSTVNVHAEVLAGR